MGLGRITLLACLALSNLALAQPTSCPPNRVAPLMLPRVKKALATNHELTIVAIGSSSTEGVHASNIGHSYPAVLQAELERAFPDSHIAVLNRGIGGQDVAEMLPRLERDALVVKPTLVIWQVGANGAMRKINPEVFKRLVGNGVQRLQEAQVDVVLMDNQRAPAILASPQHVAIDEALADVAKSGGAGLFARGALMDAWQRDGFPYTLFDSDDGVHHNDFGYACVAKALAAAIIDGVGDPAKADAVRSASNKR